MKTGHILKFSIDAKKDVPIDGAGVKIYSTFVLNTPVYPYPLAVFLLKDIFICNYLCHVFMKEHILYFSNIREGRRHIRSL